jgi:hypothetical protein
MEAILESVRVAVLDGATDGERRRGIVAMRELADALEARLATRADPAAPSRMSTALAPPAPPPRPPPRPVDVVPPSDVTVLPVGSAIPSVTDLASALPRGPNPFAGLSADQILDVVIERLRHAAGETAPVPASPGSPNSPSFRLNLVPVPRFP